MAVFIDKKTKVLVQGITGRTGSFQTKIMKDYGTKIVAGVTPGKGGQEIYGIPIYDFIEEVITEHDVNATISFVPAKFALDAAYEAIDAGIQFMVITAEGIPNIDVLKMIQYGCAKNTRILGPDTPGLISPGKCKMGVHPNRFFIAPPYSANSCVFITGTLTMESASIRVFGSKTFFKQRTLGF